LLIQSSQFLQQDQEAQYNLLLSLQAELLAFIKDGVAARDVYQRALKYVKEKRPELEKFFVKNVGFSVGFFRVSYYYLLFTDFQDWD